MIDGGVPSSPRAVDELSDEVSIRAKIDQSGLTIAGKSRALAAFDRLLGGLIGWPAARFEGIRQRTEVDQSAQTEVRRLGAQGAVADAAEKLNHAALRRMAAAELRKQQNIEAVLVEAKNALLALASPDSAHLTDNTSGAESEPVDEDWMNIFARHAEDASGKRLRETWGRILAGEVRQPGTFSLSTLRFVAELDAKIALTFQKWARVAVGPLILKPEPLQGQPFDELSFLAEVGLVTGVDGSVNITLGRQPDGSAYITGRDLGLHLVTEWTQPIQFSVLRLSRAGVEIAGILPRDEREPLMALAKQFHSVAQTISIFRVVKTADGQVGGTDHEIVFAARRGDSLN